MKSLKEFIVSVTILGLLIVGFTGCKIRTEAEEPSVKPEWSDWIKNNYQPISSITSEEFGDLQFLKDILKNRSLVQLGESGHGVMEFNQVKVRLIKFLHQEMGFSVIAFESSIFSCWDTNEKILSKTPLEAMKSSIFAVWSTAEVRELFEYIKKTHKSNNPLILAGFDTQNSADVSQTRPQFLRDMVGEIDPDYAEEVYDKDQEVNGQFYSSLQAYSSEAVAELVTFYENLQEFLEGHQDQLIQKFGNVRYLVARQKVWSISRFILQVVSERPQTTFIRDSGMAQNLQVLADEIYPDQKIMVWAHNFHISHDQQAIYGTRTMGSWIKEWFRNRLYTIGLYMYQGKAASNSGEIYNVSGVVDDSLEAILIQPDEEYLFVDMLFQDQVNGNSWMFENISAKGWGRNPYRMFPRHQYDGLIYIKNVNPPDYQ